jgi:hypothetical protein
VLHILDTVNEFLAVIFTKTWEIPESTFVVIVVTVGVYSLIERHINSESLNKSCLWLQHVLCCLEYKQTSLQLLSIVFRQENSENMRKI